MKTLYKKLNLAIIIPLYLIAGSSISSVSSMEYIGASAALSTSRGLSETPIRFSHELSIIQSCKKEKNIYCQPKLVDQFLFELRDCINKKQQRIYKELSLIASVNKNKVSEFKARIKSDASGNLSVLSSNSADKDDTAHLRLVSILNSLSITPNRFAESEAVIIRFRTSKILK